MGGEHYAAAIKESEEAYSQKPLTDVKPCPKVCGEWHKFIVLCKNFT